MKWLIITEDDSSNDIQVLLEKTYPDCVTYSAAVSDLELTGCYDILFAITHCVIIAREINSIKLAFILGVLCGHSAEIFTIADNFSRELFTYQQMNVFYDVANLKEYISENKERIEETSIRCDAHSYLMESGVPFSPDSFAAAIVKKNERLCVNFVTAGMSASVKDSDGTPMLNIAARNDNLEMVRWLVEHGADLNQVSEDRGYTAVMDAVWRGNIKITAFLVNSGAELNTINKEGQNNLVLAVGADRADICRVLADAGADPDVTDQMGMSAYGYACLFKKNEIIEILKKYHKE